MSERERKKGEYVTRVFGSPASPSVFGVWPHLLGVLPMIIVLASFKEARLWQHAGY